MTRQQAAKLGELVDKLGAVEASIPAEVAALISERDRLRKTLRAALTEEDAAKAFTIPGNRFIASIGPCEPRRVIIEMKAAQKAVGRDTFLERATLALKDLDELLPAVKVQELVEVERIGPRPLEVTAIPKRRAA